MVHRSSLCRVKGGQHSSADRLLRAAPESHVRREARLTKRGRCSRSRGATFQLTGFWGRRELDHVAMSTVCPEHF